VAEDPTTGGHHGFVDEEGYVRDETEGYTGWRSVNFFPYAIFTPLTGSYQLFFAIKSTKRLLIVGLFDF